MDINLDSPLVKDFVEKKAGPKAYSILKAMNKDKKNTEKSEDINEENRSDPDKEGRTDQEIKEEVEIEEINEIRSVLNRLHYLGIIEYDKEKAKKSNWYTYTWSIKRDRIKELLKERYEEELEKLEKELEMKQNYVFFECENGCDKHPFEVAYEYDFECPDCGEKMDKSKENGKEEIKERIGEIKEFLGK